MLSNLYSCQSPEELTPESSEEEEDEESKDEDFHSRKCILLLHILLLLHVCACDSYYLVVLALATPTGMRSSTT